MALNKVAAQVTCPNCRMANLEGSPYCSRCGATLNDVAVSFVQAATAQPDSRVNSVKQFLNDGQDYAPALQVHEWASQIRMDGEEIQYIAIANKTMVGVAPACSVATNQRLMDFKRKILGKFDLDYCLWRDIRDIQMKEGRHGVSLIVETIQGWTFTAEALPRVQAWKLYEVGAEHNARLRSHLDEMLDEVHIEEQKATEFTIEPVVAPMLRPDEQKVDMVEPEFMLAQSDYHMMPQTTSISSAGPLPMVTPPLAKSQPALDAQPPTFMQVGSTLDRRQNLDFALPLPRGPEGSSAPLSDEKHITPSAPPAEQVLPEPAGIAQSGEILLPDQQVEPRTSVPVPVSLPHHIMSYQPAPQALPVSIPYNASNMVVNGSDYREGNGAIRTLVSSNTPQPEPSQARPAKGTSNLPLRTAVPTEVSNQAADSNLPPGSRPDNPGKPNAPQESPMRKLRQLKRLLDVGLISEVDYEAKKVEILDRF